MKTKVIMVTFLFYLGISIGGLSFGTPIDIYSNPGLEGLGSFDGSVDYSFVDDTQGQLIIELTNTSPEENTGYITALAFLFPEDSIGVSSFTSPDNTNFTDGLNYPVSAVPFDDYDSGITTGGSWLGGGSPKTGIAVGDTANFYFNLTGTGLSSLGTTDFVSNNNFLAVRFRGFADGGSDKVTSGGGGAQVPEPATVLLLGSGLLGLFGYRKKFWKPKN